MRALVLDSAPGRLQEVERPLPVPGPHEIRVRVEACGVCRTDVHLLDGELPMAELPVIPGHQIVGVVEELGGEVTRWAIGDRVGVPWLGRTCGTCRFCASGDENLCDDARFTGCQLDGGFAEAAVADENYVFEIPESVASDRAAPLLCAGLIGLRTLRKAGDASRVGVYGFGSAAHIVTRIARHEGREVFAFVRPGDGDARSFATRMGASWAGGSDEAPPLELDAALIFAPVGPLVPVALKVVRKGGRVICGGIHMSDIPSFPYELLWGERRIESVANLTRSDGEELMRLADEIPLEAEVTKFSFDQANEAIDAIREGRLTGSAVLEIQTPQRG